MSNVGLMTIPKEIEPGIRIILSTYIAEPIDYFAIRPIGGGSINNTYQLIINKGLLFFCKINSIEKFPDLFEKEKMGIELLKKQQVIDVPDIIACENIANVQVLIIEWIEQGLKSEEFWLNFGEQLAKLHFVTNSFFGLEEDNYMGALPQSNRQHNNWIDFLVYERFIPQLALALKNDLLNSSHGRQFENLYKELQNIFPVEKPSLIHGDLWSGNFLVNEYKKPVLIDPAVYMGHRSMDLAMTTLFGGFDKTFYEAYDYHFPFPANYQEQWEICNLYPLLIHLNLFGKSYQTDIIQTIQKY